MAKQKINVKGTEIVIFSQKREDYISLTDIAKYKNPEAPSAPFRKSFSQHAQFKTT